MSFSNCKHFPHFHILKCVYQIFISLEFVAFARILSFYQQVSQSYLFKLKIIFFFSFGTFLVCDPTISPLSLMKSPKVLIESCFFISVFLLMLCFSHTKICKIYLPKFEQRSVNFQQNPVSEALFYNSLTHDDMTVALVLLL